MEPREYLDILRRRWLSVLIVALIDASGDVTPHIGDAKEVHGHNAPLLRRCR